MSPVHRYQAASNYSKSSSGGNNLLKEPMSEVDRPVSRSREAAASAMLELKTAGQYRSGPSARPRTPHGIPTSSHHPQRSQATSSSPKFTGSIVPLDTSRQHYKWTIEGQNYIVSAAGVQALDAVRIP